MESVRYTERYLARVITANQNNFANDVLKLCPYGADDGGMAGFNDSYLHEKLETARYHIESRFHCIEENSVMYFSSSGFSSIEQLY